eukprot:12751581-Alexandrium_andersonii.AAC.1
MVSRSAFIASILAERRWVTLRIASSAFQSMESGESNTSPSPPESHSGTEARTSASSRVSCPSLAVASS